MRALWQSELMQLTPRYGNDPIITLDGSPSDILAPVTRQRRRFAASLENLTGEQWDHPSRCAGWSNRDVVIHVDSTNSFWAFSISAGLKGEPTRFLATFDPVTSPAQLVAGSQKLTSREVLDRFTASTAALEATLKSLTADQWSTLAEAPPGHVSISAVAHHALWDSWVHERDVLLPLGIEQTREDDEIIASLRYAAALAPGFAISRGSHENGTLAIETTAPDTGFLVDVRDHVHVRVGTGDADLRLDGDAIDLVEALSIRAPLVQEIPARYKWMVNGLAEIFDVESQVN